jgi:DNA repair protein RadC
MGPRERLFLEGIGKLGEVELLSVLLGTGTSGEPVHALAASLYLDCGGLLGLLGIGPRELAARRGIGHAKAARIIAGLELGRRALLAATVCDSEVVTSIECVERWAKPLLSALGHEEVWLLCLDARNGVLSRLRVASGGLHGCAVTPKDILRPAIREGAAGIVLVHNHPSGNPEPSTNDVEMTRFLASAAKTVGIELLDHIIVSKGGSCSLLDRGVLD